MSFFSSVMLNICHALINLHAPPFVYVFISFVTWKNKLSTVHFHRHETTWVPEEGNDRRLRCEYFFVTAKEARSPCWCKWKCAMCLVVPDWAESSRARSHGGVVVFGVCLFLCQRVGGFMGPSPSVLLSQVQHFQRARDMNWGHRGERSFLEDVWDLQSHHEVEDELRTGCHAELDHLSIMCLSNDCCH